MRGGPAVPPIPHPAPPQPKPIGPLSNLESEPEVPAYLPVSHELRLPLNVGICKNCRRIFRSSAGGGEVKSTQRYSTNALHLLNA